MDWIWVKDLNLQFQPVSKMALQSQLVLDIKRTIKGTIKGTRDIWNVKSYWNLMHYYIHNAMSSMKKAWATVKEMANQTSELFQSL